MTFGNDTHANSEPVAFEKTPARPRFDSKITSDRLREGSGLSPIQMVSNIKKGRKSVFREVGLDGDDDDGCRRKHVESCDEKGFGEITGLATEATEPSSPVQGRTDNSDADGAKARTRWFSILSQAKRPRIKPAASAPPPTVASLHRLISIALLIAVVLPAISYNSGRKKVDISGADAGVIKKAPGIILDDRANSPVDVCLRWAHQSASLNGTVYIYGGEAKTSGDQDTDTWNNDFLTLDLTKSWQVANPPLTGLPQPSGPPAVSLGYLWNDYNNLFLYGGEFADNPRTTPTSPSTWKYTISSAEWTEYQNPKTSKGDYSTDAGIPIQRAAEGAGVSVPELGRSWYFGGHLDLATSPGWSDQIARVYLKSLLELTHPGYANPAVDSLHASGAGDGGAYRNITEGGIQEQAGFSERADGALVFVPGWGPSGILLGLGGGSTENNDTADQFSSMQTIDVYDIETSTWYHQQTTGQAPEVRVNPCAVIFSAPDASSFNIYMYGGQNLLPVAGQTQYTDMWILTIPSFTWMKVNIGSDGEPPGRAGHTCHARDGQIVVIGGYIGQTTNCDRPGIYVFDASTLQWKDSFTAGEHVAAFDPDNSVLGGSYGYQVPQEVQSVIGGSSAGGATATTPVSSATGGPFATGKAPVFTITQSDSTATVTNWSPTETQTTVGGGGVPVDPGSSHDSSGPSGGTVAAGVIAGLAGLTAGYLGFCAWLYRRQVTAYRKHMAVANAYGGRGGDAADNDDMAVAGGAAGVRERLRKHPYYPYHRRHDSSSSDDSALRQFDWIGQLGEPKRMSTSDEPSPGSGMSGTGTGSGSLGGSGRPLPSEDRNPWGWYESATAGVGAGAATGGGGTGGAGGGVTRMKSDATRSSGSGSSTENLLGGREPNFFSVIMGPRRALRVVNAREEQLND